LYPSATVSTKRRFRDTLSISSARSTRSATSSPKSPTAASELMFLVDAFCRRRSCLESGTRVNKSSSTRARASMRAISRFANALCTMSSSPCPISSGASPTSLASSCVVDERARGGQCAFARRKEDAIRCESNVHLLIGCSPMRNERHPAQDLVRVLSARKYRKPRTSHGQRTGGQTGVYRRARRPTRDDE